MERSDHIDLRGVYDDETRCRRQGLRQWNCGPAQHHPLLKFSSIIVFGSVLVFGRPACSCLMVFIYFKSPFRRSQGKSQNKLSIITSPGHIFF